MSNTTQKTEQELANESFDKRMKKEAYKGSNASVLFGMFKKSVMKYSANAIKFSPEYLRHLIAKNNYNYYDIGVMLNVLRGAAFEMLGCNGVNDVAVTYMMLDEEYRIFDSVAKKCWEAAEKEAKSKIKVAKK